ncbi:hypothetical protein [Candidatus Liberibacter africanus]|nr:hypothetical protein [Candidatus Liberibacter africanus]
MAMINGIINMSDFYSCVSPKAGYRNRIIFMNSSNAFYDWAKRNHHYERIWFRVANFYLFTMFSILNHELGHATRTTEMNSKVTKLRIYPLSMSGYTSYESLGKYPESAVVTLGGIEANYVLSRDAFYKKRRINPTSATMYLSSAGNQFAYVKFIKDQPGHDINSYVKDIALIYNLNYDKFITRLRRLALLDWLDIRIYYSFYSVISGRDTVLPALKVTKNVGILPSMRLIITPYAVLEKRFLLDVFAGDKEVRMGFSYERDVRGKDHLYYGEIEINKIASLKKTDIGAHLIVWKQPELLVQKDFSLVSNKHGAMVTLDLLHHLTDHLKFSMRIGYKANGYVMGEPVHKSSIVKFGLSFI